MTSNNEERVQSGGSNMRQDNGLPKANEQPPNVWKQKVEEKLSEMPSPLSPDAAVAFFDAMSEVYRVSDEYNLELPFTNFVFFGPQSAGKSTLVERILGFPITIIRDVIGTRRPLIITTRRRDAERYVVRYATGRNAGGAFVQSSEEVLPDRMTIRDRIIDLNDEVKGTDSGVSDLPIYLEVDGPQQLTLRFVDLMGYQEHGAQADMIAQVLRNELQNERTIVVGVSAPDMFVQSRLLSAIKTCLYNGKEGLQKLRSRMIFCVNKADKAFVGPLRTKENTLRFYGQYCDDANFGLLPLLVGDSCELDENGEPKKLGEPVKDFAWLEQDYAGAPAREEASIRKWLPIPREAGLPIEEMTKKALGFHCLLGMINAYVMKRDLSQLGRIQDKLEQHIQHLRETLRMNEEESSHLINFEDDLPPFLRKMMQLTREIAYQIPSTAVQAWLANEGVRTEDGWTLAEEDNFFAERRDGKDTSLCRVVSYHNKYEADKEIAGKWKDYVTNADTPTVQFSTNPMIGGMMYGRMQAAFATHVYRFHKPSKEDLWRLINAVPEHPEIAGDLSLLRAKRLAEIHANRLRPSIEWYASRNLFLMDRMFDLAWVMLQNEREHRNIRNAFGTEGFVRVKSIMRSEFIAEMKEYAAQALELAFGDLDMMINDLFSFRKDGPAREALLSAFPQRADKIRAGFNSYDKNAMREVEMKREKMEGDHAIPSLLQLTARGLGKLLRFKEDDYLRSFWNGIQIGEQLLATNLQHPVQAVSHVLLQVKHNMFL